jgi:hypothetical protein
VLAAKIVEDLEAALSEFEQVVQVLLEAKAPDGGRSESGSKQKE